MRPVFGSLVISFARFLLELLWMRSMQMGLEFNRKKTLQDPGCYGFSQMTELVTKHHNAVTVPAFLGCHLFLQFQRESLAGMFVRCSFPQRLRDTSFSPPVSSSGA